MSLPLACQTPLNNPHRTTHGITNVYYSTFSAQPKTLDPVRSYSSDEYQLICQVYEPPLQYHYLKRPFQLVPLTAESIPQPRYFDAKGNELSSCSPASQVHRVLYEIEIKKGIFYQNHPCFAQDPKGNYLYHQLSEKELSEIYGLKDFGKVGTRELKADDYIYQIYRMADPRNNCPVFPLMKKYILGLDTFSHALASALEEERERRRRKAGLTYNQETDEKENPIHLDYTRYPFPGVVKKDDFTFQIILKRKYPQILYWLATPFFSPIPWEAEKFYQQGPLIKRNITLQCCPVGTGPFKIGVFDPALEITLEKNEHFHNEVYPTAGEPTDKESGYLDDAGKPLPFLERVVFKLERESIPRWNKFLQGYYDASGISSDNFDQVITFSPEGLLQLTESFKEKGIKLLTSTTTTTFYFAFNMLDPVVGGYTTEKEKLRQAISIAVDIEEWIEIFANGRGIPAHSPLPPGIFGYEEGKGGINPYVYTWDMQRNKPMRRPITHAQQLLSEAGYPRGIDPTTGKPLIIGFDNSWTGPESHAQLRWLQKQFQKLGIALESRTTDYNRFQEKVLTGNFQLLFWGWNADYPDPENFFFLLYGPNGKKRYGGENAANYDNPEFNSLYKAMESMDNTLERLDIIKKMIRCAQRDAPWIWGYHPQEFGLYHSWVFNAKPHSMANNTIKYIRIDPHLRQQLQEAWNKPLVWPLVAIWVILLVTFIPAVYTMRKKRSF